MLPSQSVETFGGPLQLDLKQAVADLVGLSPSDLEIVLLHESLFFVPQLVAEIRGVPLESNVTLGDVARNIENASAGDALGAPLLPFTAHLDLPPRVFWGVIVTVWLESGIVESVDRQQQNALTFTLGTVLGVEWGGVRITGLENTGDAAAPLAVQLFNYVSGSGSLLQSMLEMLQSTAISRIQNAYPGSVRSQFENLEKNHRLPEPIAQGGLRIDLPHVSVRVSVFNGTVGTFDSVKQSELKTAVAQLAGMHPDDLEVVLLHEPSLDVRALLSEVRGVPSISNVTLIDIAQKLETSLSGDELLINTKLDGPPRVVFCPPGQFLDFVSNQCFDCGSGFWKDDDGPGPCSKCASSMAYSPLGSISPLQCSPILTEAQGCEPPPNTKFDFAFCSSPTVCGNTSPLLSYMRRGHSAVNIGNRFIVVFGGELIALAGNDGSQPTDDSIYVLDVHLPRRRWAQITSAGPSPGGRSYASSIVHENEMHSAVVVVAGKQGPPGESVHVARCFVVSFAREAACIQDPQTDHDVVYPQYVYGGRSTATGETLSDLWALHLGVWRWRRVSPNIGQPQAVGLQAVMVLQESTLVLLGGIASPSAIGCSTDVIVSNLLTNGWTEYPGALEVSGGRCWDSATAEGNKSSSLFLFDSGRTHGLPGLWTLSTQDWTLQEVDVAWPQIKLLPGYAFFASRNLFAAFGSECAFGTNCSMHALDLASLLWAHEPVLNWDNRFLGLDADSLAQANRTVSLNPRPVVVVFGPEPEIKAVVFGGEAPLDSFDLLTRRNGWFALRSLREDQNTVSPSERERMATAVLDDELLLFGGASLADIVQSDECDMAVLSDTWIYNLNHQRWLQIQPTGGSHPSSRLSASM
eukprot:921620-Rhodomonas_salina.1